MTLLMPKAAGWQSSLYSNRKNMPVYVIHDQDQTSFILTEQTGLTILEMLSGDRTPEQIQEALQTRLGLRMEYKQICEFLDLCEQNNLLVAGTWKNEKGAGSSPRELRSRGIWKSLGFHKILVRTEGLSNWLDAHRNLWLNPFTVTAYAVLTLAGLLFVVWPGNAAAALSNQLQQLIAASPYLGLGFLVAMFLEIGLHELGHTAACAYFKVKSKGWGVGLLWGVLPIFFTETSGVYTLNNKYKRILVSLAGPMVDLAILGGCALLSLLATPGSYVQSLASTYIAVPLSMLLINLNPLLIRMDGYWIVVDLLEKPNLRSAALRYLKTRLWQCFSRASDADVRWADSQVARDAHSRWIYLGFFALSAAWTLGFVVRMVLAFFGNK